MSAFLPAAAFLMGFSPCLSIGAANVAVGMFFVGALAAEWSGTGGLTKTRTAFDGPVLFFMAAWAAASAFGMDPAKSFGKILSQTRFIPFYLLLATNGGRHRPAALRGYLWGAGVACLYGGLQFVASHSGVETGLPGLFAALDGGEHWMTLRGGRVHGSVHPLTFAEVVLPFFLLGAAFLLEADDRRKMWRGAGWLSASGMILILTESRGPWIGAAVGLAVLSALHPRRLRLAAPLLAVGLAAIASPSVRTRLSQVTETRMDDSSRHRLILWHNTWQVARRHLLTGVGPNCLKAAVERHQTEPGFLPNPWGKENDAHNQYLQHLAERGLPGLAALLWLMAAPIIAAARALREPTPAEGGVPARWVLWGLLAFFIAFPFLNLTERVFDDAEPAMVFWILAAMIVR